jgi:hypothetical protein
MSLSGVLNVERRMHPVFLSKIEKAISRRAGASPPR